MLIRKAVIPAAGLGTRLLPATKEQPKEMLPIFAAGDDGKLCLKPMLQQIFEHLYDFGVREFFFIVGREKRAIEDHFSPDVEFIRGLNSQRKNGQAQLLERFYDKIENSTILWVNQPVPKGFGHAVLQVESLVQNESFLVHAGDTLIISKAESIARRLATAHASGTAEVTLTIKEVEDPRQYGVAEVKQSGTIFEVSRVVEKPEHPTTKLALMPIYIFNPSIFPALRATRPGKGGELQLTDGIQKLRDAGHKVQAVKLDEEDIRLDIGTPETYWEALELSYRSASAKRRRAI